MRTFTTTLRDFLHQNTDARVVDLLTITLQSATVFRWTSHGEDITTGGNTFTAGGTGTVPLIGRGKIRDAIGLDPSDLDLTLSCGSSAELGSGVKLQLAAANGVLDGARVKLERCYLDAAGSVIGTLNRFEGQVSDVEASSVTVTLKVSSDVELLNQVLPRHSFRGACSHALFDAGCGVVASSYSSTGTVQSGTTISSVIVNSTLATGYFNGGRFIFTSGSLNGLVRTVASMTNAGSTSTFTFTVPLPSAPSIGDGVQMFPGCDKTASTCKSKFINLPRRRGFDFIPAPEMTGTQAGDSRTVQNMGMYGGQSVKTIGNKTSTASYGKPIPIVYGTHRIDGNVIFSGTYIYVYGGRGSASSASQVALCEGPVSEVLAIWKEKTKYTPGSLSMTVMTGSGITAWSAGTAYVIGDWCSSGGTNYVAILGGTNHVPPNGLYWEARGSSATERAQSAWSYLTSTYPAFALGYGGTAIGCVSSGHNLNAVGELERCSFEVKGRLCYLTSSGAVEDAQPPRVLVDLLTNPEYGMAWPTSRIEGYYAPGGSDPPTGFTAGVDGTFATGWAYFCSASGIGVSLSISEQRPVRSIIEEILSATYATAIWSEGQLKARPLSTDYVYGASGSYQGDTSVIPFYDLGASQTGADLLASEGEDPVNVERKSLKEHFNCFPVEWSNRTPSRVDITGSAISEPFNAYNAELEEGTPDPVDVQLYGTRKAETTTLRCITNKAHAVYISNALASRSISSRNTYRFRLPWRFALLEPCDLVTVTDPNFGLSRRLVRILEIEEDETGAFDVKAEEVGTVPVAAAATYTLT